MNEQKSDNITVETSTNKSIRRDVFSRLWVLVSRFLEDKKGSLGLELSLKSWSWRKSFGLNLSLDKKVLTFSRP